MNELCMQLQACSFLQVYPYISYLGQPLLSGWRLKIWYLVFSAKFLSGGHPKKVNQHSSCARLALIQRAFLQQMCLQLGFCWESVGGKLIF